MDVSEDYLLGGRVLIKQPKDGYRVSMDALFLSAAVQPDADDTVLDIGAGVGATALCLASRVPTCRVVGVELNHDYVRLASENVRLNHLKDRVEILRGTLKSPPPRLAAGSYAHVMTNPPYFMEGEGRLSPNKGKTDANHQTEATLAQWINFSLLMAKPKGSITFIYKADRLDALLHHFHGKMGDVCVFPLWPGNGKPAKRVLVRGIKNSDKAMKLMPGLVLHESDGRYTNVAENILRHAQGLDLDTQQLI